jgi:hypothetical protein
MFMKYVYEPMPDYQKPTDGAEGVMLSKDMEDWSSGRKSAARSLMVDANGSYSAANAIQIGKRLQQMKYLWFEGSGRRADRGRGGEIKCERTYSLI